MKTNFSLLFVPFLFIRFCICAEQIQGCFPNDKLPSHITPLTSFGQRAEWSRDGRTVFFVDKAGGDVFAVDVLTKDVKQITKPEHRPQNHGYYRVFVMWNGDLLLGHGAERHKLHFQVLDKSLELQPWSVEGEYFDEGPAVSRTSNKIAWTKPGQGQIYTGEFHYSSEGKPGIINKKLILDNSKEPIIDEDGTAYSHILETQDFNPVDENILIWNQYLRNDYGFRSEVMSINLLTGNIRNHTKSPHLYDEAEGIFPCGEYTTVESDRHRPGRGTGGIDIYRLRLDGTSDSYERLTYFTDLEGYRSSNPVISDCGKYMVFQASTVPSPAGFGCGLYIFDFEQYNRNIRGF